MKTSELASYSKLVDRIYEAGFNPAQWADVVEAFRISLGGSAASLYAMDPRGIDDAWFVSQQVGPGAGRDYCRFHPQRNPHREWRIRNGMPVNFAFSFSRVTPRAELERTDIFQQFYRRYDIRDCAIAVLDQGTRGHFGLAVLYDRFDAAIDPSITDRLSAAIPHLNRALAANRNLAERNLWQGLGTAALDQLCAAAILVGRDLRVLYASPKAEALLNGQDGVRAPYGKLEAATADATAALLRAVGLAGEGPAATGADLLLPRRSGGAPLQVQVLPAAPGLAGVLQAGKPAALLFIREPEQRSRQAEERLALQYGLTETESDVLAALVKGATPKEIAARFHVTVRAVRFHLSNLFAKTGTARQADLVRAALTHLGHAPTAP